MLLDWFTSGGAEDLNIWLLESCLYEWSWMGLNSSASRHAHSEAEVLFDGVDVDRVPSVSSCMPSRSRT